MDFIKQVRDTHGKLTHYVAAFSDITEARRTRKASAIRRNTMPTPPICPIACCCLNVCSRRSAQAKRDKNRSP